mmetsp:Transcript_6217/g.17545  ORF Transcript_6217/g.17545 Transcript_6217/m.17545 type:complete len:82 (-) Transcript_6217:20-265(-)
MSASVCCPTPSYCSARSLFPTKNQQNVLPSKNLLVRTSGESGRMSLLTPTLLSIETLWRHHTNFAIGLHTSDTNKDFYRRR